jgi:hypothetical protein
LEERQFGIFSTNFLPGTFRTEISLARNFPAVQLFQEKNPEKIPDNIYPPSNAGFTMQETVCFENYPVGFIIASNLVSLLIYIIGAFLLYELWPVLVIPYILFILLLEYRLLSGHCTDCWYYGKACAFGRGWLSARLFKKGRPEDFCGKQITWKDVVPDFLVFIVPVVAGIVLLLTSFRVLVLTLVIALLVLGFLGNAIVRGQLACRFCRQREIGCPAVQMFEKKKS